MLSVPCIRALVTNEKRRVSLIPRLYSSLSFYSLYMAESQSESLPVSELMRLVGFDSNANRKTEVEKEDYYYSQQWFQNTSLHGNFVFQCIAAKFLECHHHRSTNDDVTGILLEAQSLDWEER